MEQLSGKKRAGKDSQDISESEKIIDLINDNIKELHLSQEAQIDISLSEDGLTVTASGDNITPKTKKKILTMLSNIDTIKHINDHINLCSSYTIKAGNTLTGISQEMYGRASHYMAIFEANTDTLTDPNKIYAGKRITIPQIPVDQILI